MAGGTSGRFDGEPIGLDLVAVPSTATPASVRLFASPTTRQGPNDQMYYSVIGSLETRQGLKLGRYNRLGHADGLALPWYTLLWYSAGLKKRRSDHYLRAAGGG